MVLKSFIVNIGKREGKDEEALTGPEEVTLIADEEKGLLQIGSDAKDVA